MATVVESFAPGSAAVMRAVTRIWFPLFMTVLMSLVLSPDCGSRARRRHLARGWAGHRRRGFIRARRERRRRRFGTGPSLPVQAAFLVILVAVSLVLGIIRLFPVLSYGALFPLRVQYGSRPGTGIGLLRCSTRRRGAGG